MHVRFCCPPNYLLATQQLGPPQCDHDFARATKLALAPRAAEFRRHFAMSRTTATPPMTLGPVFQTAGLKEAEVKCPKRTKSPAAVE
jgi:hypothetical protein